MKTILSMDAYQKISKGHTRHFQNPPTFRDNSSQCVSVTGQPLIASRSMVAQLAFPGSQYLYEGEFQICNNVLQPLPCILGCDFIVSHHLQLSILGDTYVLVGRHGSTPLTPLPLSAISTPSPNLSAGAYASPSLGQNPPLFLQSPTWGPVKVTFQNNFTLPARTECILLCKILQRCSNQFGMISPRGESSAYYIACTVSQADNRHIPVRVMNPSNHSLEFRANQNIAEFIPVSELVPNSLNQNKPFLMCTTLEGPTELAPESLTE